jgi:hypothetical protein
MTGLTGHVGPWSIEDLDALPESPVELPFPVELDPTELVRRDTW